MNSGIALREMLPEMYRHYREKRLNADRLNRALGKKQFDFQCTGCGHCCQGGGIVYFSEGELQQIESFLEIPRRERAEFRKRFVQRREGGYHQHDSGTDCFFLEGGQCSVYPVRPLQCRAYPYWPSVFQSKMDLKEHKKSCPGMMREKGQKLNPETIIRKTNHTLREFLSEQPDGLEFIDL